METQPLTHLKAECLYKTEMVNMLLEFMIKHRPHSLLAMHKRDIKVQHLMNQRLWEINSWQQVMTILHHQAIVLSRQVLMLVITVLSTDLHRMTEQNSVKVVPKVCILWLSVQECRQLVVMLLRQDENQVMAGHIMAMMMLFILDHIHELTRRGKVKLTI